MMKLKKYELKKNDKEKHANPSESFKSRLISHAHTYKILDLGSIKNNL